MLTYLLLTSSLASCHRHQWHKHLYICLFSSIKKEKKFLFQTLLDFHSYLWSICLFWPVRTNRPTWTVIFMSQALVITELVYDWHFRISKIGLLLSHRTVPLKPRVWCSTCWCHQNSSDLWRCLGWNPDFECSIVCFFNLGTLDVRSKPQALCHVWIMKHICGVVARTHSHRWERRRCEVKSEFLLLDAHCGSIWLSVVLMLWLMLVWWLTWCIGVHTCV